MYHFDYRPIGGVSQQEDTTLHRHHTLFWHTSATLNKIRNRSTYLLSSTNRLTHIKTHNVMKKPELVTGIIELLALTGAEADAVTDIIDIKSVKLLQPEYDRLKSLPQAERTLPAAWITPPKVDAGDTVLAEIKTVDLMLRNPGVIAPTYEETKAWRAMVFVNDAAKGVTISASVYQVDHLEKVENVNNVARGQDNMIFIPTGDGCRLEIGSVYKVTYYVGIAKTTHAVDENTGDIIPFKRDQLRLISFIPTDDGEFIEKYEAAKAVFKAAAKAKIDKAYADANKDQFDSRLGNIEAAINIVGEEVAKSQSFKDIMANLEK